MKDEDAGVAGLGRPTPELQELVLEPMQPEDLAAVELIERSSFKEPWPAGTFLAELSRPIARVTVARMRGRVLGFCNYWLVLDEVSLMAIAVHPDHRGAGIAARLLADLLSDAQHAAARLVTLEVRAGNQPAISLYTRAGFAVSYVRQRYYGDGEDALVMTRGLAALPAPG